MVKISPAPPQEPGHKANCRAGGFLCKADVCCFCRGLGICETLRMSKPQKPQLLSTLPALTWFKFQKWCSAQSSCNPSRKASVGSFAEVSHLRISRKNGTLLSIVCQLVRDKAGAAPSKYHMHIHAFSAPSPAPRYCQDCEIGLCWW